MVEELQIYKCVVCGAVAEVIHAGNDLVCCGKIMELVNEKTSDIGLEKHKPVIEKTPNGFKIKVGSIPHPMVSEHRIEWIEIIFDGKSYRKKLHPGEAPEVEFCSDAKTIKARAYCNIHGLWSTTQ
jgi:superoxide reductase